jgi:hypothetical protein
MNGESWETVYLIALKLVEDLFPIADEWAMGK